MESLILNLVKKKAVKQALAGRMGDEELSKEINDLMQKDKM